MRRPLDVTLDRLMASEVIKKAEENLYTSAADRPMMNKTGKKGGDEQTTEYESRQNSDE